jgi:hypothetical protein
MVGWFEPNFGESQLHVPPPCSRCGLRRRSSARRSLMRSRPRLANTTIACCNHLLHTAAWTRGPGARCSWPMSGCMPGQPGFDCAARRPPGVHAENIQRIVFRGAACAPAGRVAMSGFGVKEGRGFGQTSCPGTPATSGRSCEHIIFGRPQSTSPSQAATITAICEPRCPPLCPWSRDVQVSVAGSVQRPPACVKRRLEQPPDPIPAFPVDTLAGLKMGHRWRSSSH